MRLLLALATLVAITTAKTLVLTMCNCLSPQTIDTGSCTAFSACDASSGYVIIAGSSLPYTLTWYLDSQCTQYLANVSVSDSCTGSSPLQVQVLTQDRYLCFNKTGCDFCFYNSSDTCATDSGCVWHDDLCLSRCASQTTADSCSGTAGCKWGKISQAPCWKAAFALLLSVATSLLIAIIVPICACLTFTVLLVVCIVCCCRNKNPEARLLVVGGTSNAAYTVQTS